MLIVPLLNTDLYSVEANKNYKTLKNQVHCRSNPLSSLDTKARLMHYNCNAIIVFLFH